MIKKILMVIGALTIIGVIVLVGGTYYVGNKITGELEKREPEFRQYVTMTTEEQNAYVSKNVDAFYNLISSLAGESDEELAEFQTVMKQLDSDPEIFQAKVNWGRSIVATFILANENITKDLSADVLQKLQDEKNEKDTNYLEYKKLINEYKLKQ